MMTSSVGPVTSSSEAPVIELCSPPNGVTSQHLPAVCQADASESKAVTLTSSVAPVTSSIGTVTSSSETPVVGLCDRVVKVFVSVDGLTDGCTVVVSDYVDAYVPYIYSVADQSSPIPMEFGEDDSACTSSVVSSHHWELPNDNFDALWEVLYYETPIKDELLNYVNGSLLVSDRCANATDILCLNRLVLLHGVPGTGKTTLCKALAQRLSIRLRRRYPRTILVEVNSHSLFSRFFSESGKLVAKMFRQICELLEEKNTLVVVLIDEVESLTMARQSAMSGNEPSDAIRVVNALLTQIDQLQRYSNALVIATSNLSEAVDTAFLDRADIKMRIPPPPPSAIYLIYRSCICELQRGGLIDSSDILACDPHQLLKGEQDVAIACDAESGVGSVNSRRLLKLARASLGLSGRTLRKLPVLTYCQMNMEAACSLEDYLNVLETVVERQRHDRVQLGECSAFTGKD